MAYKDSRRNRLNPILFTIVAILAILWFLAGRPIETAIGEWRNGNYEAAIGTLDSWSKFHLRPADYEHVYAATYLAMGERDRAEPWLRKMANRSPDWIKVISKEEVGKRLISLGHYDSFLEYDTAVEQKGSSEELALYRAAAQLGTGRIEQAETTFSTINRGEIDSDRYETLRNAIESRKSGTFPLVLDREGRTIASYQMENDDLVAVNASFTTLIDESGGPTTFESHLASIGTSNLVQTTLDPEIQRAALSALGNRRGSLVAIDPATHEILAIASTPADGEPANLALSGEYEPASVMKPLTALTALNSQMSLDTIFPLMCRGFIVVEGKQFFDWAQHKDVPDLNDAMAVSCNVAFGQIGLELGSAPLIQHARKAGFGESVSLGLYDVRLGTIVGDILTDYQTASLAVGLDHYLTNTLHLAMIADMIA
ncbi:MAG: penicillin-binding transpeptidase domain-containing protein, partial [Thermoanaerobaculia bacterium]|nr:penicillin-binding transpeptidase domain-containing protein [Thermoanaerobaculia bacterium]